MPHCTCKYCRSSSLRRRNPDDLELLEKMAEARELYRQGVDRKQIGKNLRVDYRKLNKWLVDLIPDVDPRIERARELYLQGSYRAQIAKQLSVGEPTLNKWLADLIPDVDPRIEQARELYLQGGGKAQIMEQLHCGPAKLKEWLEGVVYVDPRIEQARELYRQGIHEAQIRKQVRVGVPALKEWLADLLPDLDVIDPRIEQVRELYLQGVSRLQIIKRFHAGEKTVNEWLADLLPDPGAIDPRIEQARELYLQGVNKTQIKKQLHADRLTVNRWLADLLPPKRRYLRRRNPDDLENLEKMVEARELYKKTRNIIETAKEVGVSSKKVSDWVADLILETAKRISEEETEKWKQYIDELLEKGYSKLELAKFLVSELGKRGFQYTIAGTRSWLQGFNNPPKIVLEIIRNFEFEPKKDARLELYQKGYTDLEIADELGVEPKTIQWWRGRFRLLPNKPKDPRLVLYEQGFTDIEIAEELDIPLTNVRPWRRKHDLPPNIGKALLAKKQKAVDLYRDTELGIKSIAKELGVQMRTARNWIEESGLKVRGKGKAIRKVKVDYLEVIKFIEQRGCIQISDLKERFNITEAVATRVLKDLIREGKLERIGLMGRGVKYCLIRKKRYLRRRNPDDLERT